MALPETVPVMGVLVNANLVAVPATSETVVLPHGLAPLAAEIVVDAEAASSPYHSVAVPEPGAKVTVPVPPSVPLPPLEDAKNPFEDDVLRVSVVVPTEVVGLPRASFNWRLSLMFVTLDTVVEPGMAEIATCVGAPAVTTCDAVVVFPAYVAVTV